MTAVARLLAPVTPLPTPRDPLALHMMQRARFRSAWMWLAGGVAAAQFAGLLTPLSLDSTERLWPFVVSAAIALAMVAVGATQLVLRARAERRWIGSTVGLLCAALAGVLLAPFSGLLSIVLPLGHVGAPVMAAAFGLVLLALNPGNRAGADRPVAAVSVGVTVAITILVCGLLDGLVLLPFEFAPAGMTLPEVYAALDASGEGGGHWMIVGWAALWLIAVLALASGLLRNRRSTHSSLGALVGAAALAVASLPVAQFGLGMSLGDTFFQPTSGFSAMPLLLMLATALTAVSTSAFIGAGKR